MLLVYLQGGWSSTGTQGELVASDYLPYQGSLQQKEKLSCRLLPILSSPASKEQERLNAFIIYLWLPRLGKLGTFPHALRIIPHLSLPTTQGSHQLFFSFSDNFSFLKRENVFKIQQIVLANYQQIVRISHVIITMIIFLKVYFIYQMHALALIFHRNKTIKNIFLQKPVFNLNLF